MENRCQKEIVELHQFFQNWFNGHLQPTEENFARVADVLNDEFVYIDPSGRMTEYAALIGRLWQAANTHPNFKIWIENFHLRRQEGNIALATYEEWQENADGTTSVTSVRLSTVVFREKANTPNRLEWLHVHETWLEQ
jgi:hypothetical protein